MKEPHLFDVVQLIVDLPEEGLKKNDIGAVIEVFDIPNEAFEVEFLNEDGSEKATCVLTRDQFKILNQGPW